ncbi:MAG: HprK-related kinase A [Rubrivivax sp.]
MTGASASVPAAPRLADVPTARVADALRGRGLWLDVGAATVRARSDSPYLAPQLQRAYPEFPFVDAAPWADVHVALMRARGLRRWLRPQVRLQADGREPFQPFPADHPLPMMEWGGNLFIGQRLNQLLLLHAGVVERDGLALVLPAVPGSGKSTLSAALSLSGWRLLSDEFGALDPHTRHFVPVLKPVALKNRSIDVIRGFSERAVLGPTFEKTRKGDVAHLAASADAVARRHETARPGAVVLPQWQEGAPLSFERLPAESGFRALAFNAFNYQTVGAPAFDAAVALARQCPAWSLRYSRLDEALAALDRIWPEVRDRAATEGRG